MAVSESEKYTYLWEWRNRYKKHTQVDLPMIRFDDTSNDEHKQNGMQGMQSGYEKYNSKTCNRGKPFFSSRIRNILKYVS